MELIFRKEIERSKKECLLQWKLELMLKSSGLKYESHCESLAIPIRQLSFLTMMVILFEVDRPIIIGPAVLEVQPGFSFGCQFQQVMFLLGEHWTNVNVAIGSSQIRENVDVRGKTATFLLWFFLHYLPAARISPTFLELCRWTRILWDLTFLLL